MIPKDQCGLTEEVQLKIQSVFRRTSEIRKAILYGSRAKGTFKPGSDIDLTIEGPQLNLRDLFKLQTKIDDLLLPHKTDLSLIHLIDNQSLLEHIERVGVEFYTAPPQVPTSNFGSL